jgi:hypothetical protein
MADYRQHRGVYELEAEGSAYLLVHELEITEQSDLSESRACIRGWLGRREAPEASSGKFHDDRRHLACRSPSAGGGTYFTSPFALPVLRLSHEARVTAVRMKRGALIFMHSSMYEETMVTLGDAP